MNFKFFFRILTCFFCIVCVLLTLPVSGQRLRLLIGEYECSKNADCDEGWCDIDTHVCRTYPTCPELPECGDQNEVNGRCVECISNADCADSHRPYCNMGTFTCQTCPGDKPFWNGNECEACPAGTSLEGGVCACPSDKPYRVAACIGCESNKIFVSEHNACECPSDLPNWNTATNMCVESCATGLKWNGTACVECLTNADCQDNQNPLCNTDNTCTPCPSNRPSWNEELMQCEECSISRPYWNKKEQQCQACPDGGVFDLTKNKCTILLTEGGFNACPWHPGPGYLLGADKFGPYTRSYDVLISGSADDEARFYVNTTGVAPGPNRNCYLPGLVHSINGLQNYLSSYKMGTLNAGDYGHVIIYSTRGCCSFRNPGKIWLELVDE